MTNEEFIYALKKAKNLQSKSIDLLVYGLESGDKIGDILQNESFKEISMELNMCDKVIDTVIKERLLQDNEALEKAFNEFFNEIKTNKEENEDIQ